MKKTQWTLLGVWLRKVKSCNRAAGGAVFFRRDRGHDRHIGGARILIIKAMEELGSM